MAVMVAKLQYITRRRKNMVDIMDAIPTKRALLVFDELHRTIEGTYAYDEDSAWFRARQLLELESTRMIGELR